MELITTFEACICVTIFYGMYLCYYFLWAFNLMKYYFVTFIYFVDFILAAIEEFRLGYFQAWCIFDK